jgi:hypothetical protein
VAIGVGRVLENGTVHSSPYRFMDRDFTYLVSNNVKRVVLPTDKALDLERRKVGIEL